MIINKKTIMKLERLPDIYKKEIYQPLSDLPLEFGETFEHLRACPGEDFFWKPVNGPFLWGKAWQSVWMKGSFTVPAGFTEKKLYIQADTGAVETLLIVDNQYKGIFNIETEEGVRGHHHTRLALIDPQPGSVHSLALECYAGHPCPGTMPFDPRDKKSGLPETYKRLFSYVRLCRKRTTVADFVTELRILLQIARLTGPDSFRGAGIYKSLQNVFTIIPQQPSDFSPNELESLLEEARQIMRPFLDMKNGSSVPRVGITGHSHMDTAWLWTVDETRRKCARTFSNTLNLMDEYPDYTFLQSVPFHLQMMKEDYPQIFMEVKKKIEQGRWEPNGGSWVEPDCNIPSGEALTRHFLYGQAFLEENFHYRANVFWQPDVFGYSASIPQILKQCGISHFLTTKLSWNEENRFPYDTFHWTGIDGSQVLTHFNTSHCWPDPDSLISQTREIQHKDVQDFRYCSFGYGDGGGGPLSEMLDMAPYMKNIEGVPKTEYARVGSFMDNLNHLVDLPVWNGELYLELHRGTLTSFHNLKKYNRQVETLLRDGEYLYSLAAAEQAADYPAEELERLWKILLVNQFHDILPGTAIAPVNETALKELIKCGQDVQSLIKKLEKQEITGKDETQCLQIINNRGWDRSDIIINDLPGLVPADNTLLWQKALNLSGESMLLVSGMTVPAMGISDLDLVFESGKKGTTGKIEPFYRFENNKLETDYYLITFGTGGDIVSLVDKKNRRELVLPGGSLNNLVLGEDIPALWDNWDIDYDQYMKRESLKARGPWIIDQTGPIQVRLVNRYGAGLSSEITQHIILNRFSSLIEFDTRVDWQETHKLLKVEFDLDIRANRARHEIQYGHLERNTFENLSQDKMQFEVSNHRWTDLSEAGYGAALINDSSYGISVKDSTLALSLLKSGTHPDPSADRGIHQIGYALQPHRGSFSVKAVVRPACEFNSPMTTLKGKNLKSHEKALLKWDADNILLESLKMSQNGKGLIFRFYEGENMRTPCSFTLRNKPKNVWLCNMLEEKLKPLEAGDMDTIDMEFKGFEIKTLLIIW